MNARTDPFLAIDRAHELADERLDDFDAALARETAIQIAAMRSAAVAGDAETLESLAESLSHRISQSGVTETLIRTALSCGVHTTGQMLLDMVGKCLADDAEIAALKELERDDGGLDVAAMRRVAPADVRVADWSAA